MELPRDIREVAGADAENAYELPQDESYGVDRLPVQAAGCSEDQTLEHLEELLFGDDETLVQDRVDFRLDSPEARGQLRRTALDSCTENESQSCYADHRFDKGGLGLFSIRYASRSLDQLTSGRPFLTYAIPKICAIVVE